MHNALVCINNHTPYQALLGRQSHLLPSLKGGCYGNLDVKGQNNLARVSEIAAAGTIRGTFCHKRVWIYPLNIDFSTKSLGFSYFKYICNYSTATNYRYSPTVVHIAARVHANC